MEYVLSDDAIKVLSFLQEHPELDLTKNELAEEVGVEQRSIVGLITSMKRKGLVDDPTREYLGEGKVKIVIATDKGKAFDVHTPKPSHPTRKN